VAESRLLPAFMRPAGHLPGPARLGTLNLICSAERALHTGAASPRPLPPCVPGTGPRVLAPSPLPEFGACKKSTRERKSNLSQALALRLICKRTSLRNRAFAVPRNLASPISGPFVRHRRPTASPRPIASPCRNQELAPRVLPQAGPRHEVPPPRFAASLSPPIRSARAHRLHLRPVQEADNHSQRQCRAGRWTRRTARGPAYHSPHAAARVLNRVSRTMLLPLTGPRRAAKNSRTVRRVASSTQGSAELTAPALQCVANQRVK
jgi:hypothetical protein